MIRQLSTKLYKNGHNSTCLNIIRQVQKKSLDNFRHDQTKSDKLRHDQTGLNNTRQVWTKLDKSKQEPTKLE